MLIRWRFRRQYASSDRGIFYWSRVLLGAAALSHTGTAAQTETADLNTAAGSVHVDGRGTQGEGADGSAGRGTAALPQATVVTQHGGGPDDGDELRRRPWWQRDKRHAAVLEARLDAMRQEIGLLPPAQVKRAERAVRQAAEAIVQAPAAVVASEPAAFGHVAGYRKDYRNALAEIVSRGRLDDADEMFHDAVRERIDAEKARIRRIQDDDDLVIAMLVEFL